MLGVFMKCLFLILYILLLICFSIVSMQDKTYGSEEKTEKCTIEGEASPLFAGLQNAGETFSYIVRVSNSNECSDDNIVCKSVYLPRYCPGEVANTLTVTKSTVGPNLLLSWLEPNCGSLPDAYELYRGTLPWTNYNHIIISCIITGTITTTPQDTGSYYYLVVVRSATTEGSYGRSNDGIERPTANPSCVPYQDTCPCLK